ncbi:MAG TPA: GNAT family N-acetyltransferase [Roseiflexaceae bacterium]|nr:GNAT family N-acetyltransferase [Roseiflexaceae bacterium]HMP40755.1 GNAT family N-acetyltransferase [Roseiflexaceae bacterium]
MNTERAWKLFITGFTDTATARRSASRFRAGPLAAVRFSRGEQSGTPFEEFFVYDCDPSQALIALSKARRLARHYLTVLEDRPGLREAYQNAGYRLVDTEALMACNLSAVPPPIPDHAVTVVQTQAEADWYNSNDPQGIHWIMPDNLADPRMRHYAIVADGQIRARGRNLRLDAHHSYVSRVFVAEAHRGRGLARALMLQLLNDDMAGGIHWSVLTASRMGIPLYTRLGYQTFAMILNFERLPSNPYS